MAAYPGGTGNCGGVITVAAYPGGTGHCGGAVTRAPYPRGPRAADRGGHQPFAGTGVVSEYASGRGV